MSGFHELGDEFAGDDANDEWDATWAAYAAGSQPDIDSGHLPLRASLTLPIGRVDVRGDDPGIELCLFQPLAVLDLQDHVESEFDEEGDYVSALTLTLRADDSGRIDYEVTDNRGEQKDSGSLDDSGSASELLDYLIDASVRADSTHGYLNAACVEVDGRGVLIFSDDPTVRDSVAKALIAAGADYLTDSVVATNPGTRSVGGLRRRRLGANEARTIDRVLVEAVILVDAEADRIAELDFADDRIELMEAVVELARFIHQGTNSHSLAVTHLAELLAGASCHRMNPADVGRLGDVLASASGLGANAMRELVVVSELPSEASGPVSRDGDGDDSAARLLRFNSGALLSGEATTLRALDPEEVDTIESQLVVENRKTLVPASLGLPGCPLGAVATATLWASLNAADLPPSLPSGVSAELLSRELLGADEATKERIVGAHVAARARSQEVKDLLAEIVGATEHLDARPVVLGELLDLLDGTLPDYFTDVEHLDLLLPVSKFDEFVSALESIGLVREAVSLTTASLESGLSVVLRSGGDRPITVQLYRTLASGPFGVLVDPREFHTLAVPVRIGRSWCAGLHPAHRFIHACLRLDAAARDDLGLARSAVTNTPRTDSLCNEMLEMAERWGATTTVLSIVAHLDKSLPGIPTYLASVASGRTEMSRRTRRIGRRSR